MEQFTGELPHGAITHEITPMDIDAIIRLSSAGYGEFARPLITLQALYSMDGGSKTRMSDIINIAVNFHDIGLKDDCKKILGDSKLFFMDNSDFDAHATKARSVCFENHKVQESINV